MTLASVQAGEMIEISEMADPIIRDQAIRIGIYEGAKLLCTQKINEGPVILQNRLQEIAIGDKLAKNILIKNLHHHGHKHNNKHGKKRRWYQF